MAVDRIILREGLRPYVWAIAGALALMAFTFVNGYATFFNDSRTYIRGGALVTQAVTGHDFAKDWKVNDLVGERASDRKGAPEAATAAPSDPLQRNKGITANRSIYYGLLAFAGYFSGGFWLTIFVQAYSAAVLSALLFQRGFSNQPFALYLATMVGLSLFTPAGPFVAYIMPDIFAATLILGATLLLFCWDRLSGADRVVIFCIIAYSVLAHTSHVVILFTIMAALLCLGWFVRTYQGSWRALALLAGCIVIGLAGQMAFSAALTRMTGAKPLLLPHVTAHLVDMGPGYDYLKANCPKAGFAVCDFVHVLPVRWEDFLGDPDPSRGVFAVADLPTKRRLSDEQIPLATAVFRYDPVGLTIGLLWDGVSQIGRFSLESLQASPASLRYYDTKFPPDVASGIRQSLVGQGPTLLWLITLSTWGLTAASLLVLGVAMWKRGVAGENRIIVGVITGVVCNGLVCGILASPYDRFQARVIWLLPLIAVPIARQLLSRRSNDLAVSQQTRSGTDSSSEVVLSAKGAS